MKLGLISDPSSLHTKNWIEGLQEYGVDVDILFVKSWIFRKGEMQVFDRSKTILVEVPSFSSLVGNSLRNLTIGDVMNDIRYRTRLHQAVRFAGQKIKQIAVERNIDIIHAHGLATSILLAYYSGVRPYSASAWGSDIYMMPNKYPYLKSMMAKAISNASFIHVESEISANRVRKLSSNDYSKMYVSTWGVDTDIYRPSLSTDGLDFDIPQRYILSFRSLEPIYRVNMIIKAFAILKQEVEELTLVVGSNGSLRANLESLTRSLMMEESVIFTGFLDENIKRRLFSNALLYVQCPITDGVSLAMMEAMSSGLPLVSSNVGETSVLVQPEENGFLIDETNPENLAAAMMKILKDDQLRTRMGIASRRLALQKHNRSKFFQTFVKSVEAVL